MTILINKNPINVSIENEKNVDEFINGITFHLQKEKLLIQNIICDGNELSDKDLSMPIEHFSSYEFEVIPYHHYLSYAATRILQLLEESKNGKLSKEKQEELTALFEDLKNGLGLPKLAEFAPLLSASAMPKLEEIDEIAKTVKNINEIVSAPYQKLSEVKSKFEAFLNDEAKELAIKLQKGDVSKALEAISDLLYNSFETLSTLFPVLKENEANEITPFLTQIQPLISSVLDSYNNNDRVLFSDIVEYELPPLLESFIEGVNHIQEQLES